jgi:hypothetical protein
MSRPIRGYQLQLACAFCRCWIRLGRLLGGIRTADFELQRVLYGQ